MNTREATHKYRMNQWSEIIRECRSSGQTISAWCTDHNINVKSYYYWLKQVRMAACEALPELNTGNNPIVPVNIPVPTSTTNPADQESSSDLIVRFGTVTLEISNTASSTLIENTLKALQHVR